MVSVDELKAVLAANENARLEGPKRDAADRAARDAQKAKDDASIAEVLAAHPDPALSALVTGTPDPADAAVTKIDDDSYALTIDLAGGATKKVVTYGLPTMRADVANAIRVFDTRANLEAIYKAFHGLLPTDPAQFPDPSTMGTWSDAELKNQIATIVTDRRDRAATTVSTTLVPQFPRCVNDVGNGAKGTDGVAEANTLPMATGLYALSSWKNKEHTTCVKDQGARGTCVAFSTASALEMLHHMQTAERVNLSEQRMYAQYKYGLMPDPYTDGAYPSAMLGLVILGAAQGHYVAYESDWTYNPSFSRVVKGAFISHSCDGYDGACSDTMHQVPYVCALSGGLTFCAFEYPKEQNLSQVGKNLPSATAMMLTNMQERSQAVTMAIGILALGQRPLVASLAVKPGFGGSADGYFSDASGASRGGHAVHLVGWVDNAQLPSGVPSASGGGYFIVKNSWGTGWRDGGFAYMDASYLAQVGSSIVAL